MENYRHQEFQNNYIKKQHQKVYKDFLDDQIKYRFKREPSPSIFVDKNVNNTYLLDVNHNSISGLNKHNRDNNDRNNFVNLTPDRIYFIILHCKYFLVS